MTDSDWASAFRPNNVQNQPAVSSPAAPSPAAPSPAAPSLDSAPRIMPNEQDLAESILSSVAEMFMLLEQRTRESLISIIEAQEQQGLLMARKFEELERIISDNGELPITNIDALDPALADEIRASLDEETAEEPDFMPELVEPEEVPTIADINELQISVNNLAEVVDEIAPGILEIPPLTVEQEEVLAELNGADIYDGTYERIRSRFEQENWAKEQGLTMEEAFGGPIDEEPEESSLNHVAEDEVIIPEDIKTAYWEWKEGNGTFQQFVKAAGGPKGAKKYRELIED